MRFCGFLTGKGCANEADLRSELGLCSEHLLEALLLDQGPPEARCCMICRQVLAHPELRSTWWKDPRSGICFSFSATVVEMAGGIDNLRSNWLQVDTNGNPIREEEDRG